MGPGNQTSGDPRRHLRLGIVYADSRLEAWQHACLVRARQLPFVETVLVVPDAGSLPKPAPARDRRWPASWAGRLVGLRRGAMQCVVGSGGSSAEFATVAWPGSDPDATMRQLAQLDVALDWSCGQAPHELLALAPAGVWRFHFGCTTQFHDMGAGLDEYCRGADFIDIGLARDAGDGNAPAELAAGAVRIRKRSFAATVDAMLSAAPELLAHACTRWARTGNASGGRPGVQSGHEAPFTRNESRRLLAAVIGMRETLRWAIGGVTRAERWTLAVLPQPIESALHQTSLEGARYLPGDSDAGYLADGFGCVRDNRRFVLCEEYSYRQGRGQIAWLELDARGEIIDGPRAAFATDVHASFPFLFESHGDWYCCPETCAAGSVSIWKASRLPDRWLHDRVLLPDVPGVDPVLFQHGGLWWLLCTRADDAPDERLHAWHAERLDRPWRAHRLNPIKIDPRTARNAGTPFLVDGNLHRPAQDCTQTYGGRITINRIVRLTPDEFEEELVSVLTPDAQSRYPHGAHTLAAFDELTLVDAKRHEFILADLVSQARRRARRAAAGLFGLRR